VAKFSCVSPYRPGESQATDRPRDFSPAVEYDTQDSGYLETEPGIRIFWQAEGEGDPVLVLHGGPGLPGVDVWPGLSALRDTHRFVYIHQRGSGLSTRPHDRYTGAFPDALKQLDRDVGVDTQLFDLYQFWKFLGGRPLVIVGHSYGGFLASLFAAEYPECVSKLVLISPAGVVRMPAPGPDLYTSVGNAVKGGPLEAEYKQWVRELFDFGNLFKHSEESLRKLHERFFPFWFAAESNSGASDGLTYEIPSSWVGGWVQEGLFMSLGNRYDLRPLFKERITCPVLLLYGDRDTVGEGSFNDYSQSIAGIQTVVLEGSGHAPYLLADQFSSVVKEFLED